MGLAAFNRMRKQQEELKVNKINLEELTVKELKEKCEELGLEDYKSLKKEELLELLKGDK
ncbi:Rho termination factor N-terminal domain-containing protein [Clostridium sp. KNHs214]|uniref:Rho termination factor N-terminal domain-containing protein n=1 Tax=Clostridium sp. KNHs214 TaxID=1540257 RepID=UPI00054F552D|nr:Rho termination factor N-terminal domain-containing protein [Clostridium sp. KNHs214]